MSNTNGFRHSLGTPFEAYSTPSRGATRFSIRGYLTEASEHRRRGDHALAVYLETLAAVAVRTAEIQGRAA